VYEARSNPIGQFIELYCIRKPDEIAPYWKVFEEFERFESEKGYRRISKKEFTAILENEGFTTDKKKWGDNTWVTIFGLKLKNYSFDEKGTVTDSTLVQENQLPESDGLPMPKVTDVTDVTDSSLRSIYEEQSITPVTSVTSVTELIARAGREWEQLKCKNIDGSVLAEFCLWFCEQKDKNKTPSEIRSIAEKIFSITPTKTNVCIVCQDALNGDPETTAFGDVHRSCKWSPLKIKILKDIPASGYNYGDIHLNRIEEFKAGTYADLPGIVALNLISRQMAQRVKSEYAVPIQDLHKKAADITNKAKKRPDDLDFAQEVLIAALKDADPSYEKSTLAWVANTALMDRGWNAENHESSIKGGV
jgi:hypothetical protein